MMAPDEEETLMVPASREVMREQEWRDAEAWCRKKNNLVLFFVAWLSFCLILFGALFAVIGYGPGVFAAILGVCGIGWVMERTL